jgi:organic radical activating enzyme
MFNIKDYYESCANDDVVDNSGLYNYLRSFDNVILWGASYTGEAIGKKLISQNVNFNGFWDLRAKELRNVLGKPVSLPFSEELDREKSIIIVCIPNHVIMPQILSELISQKYIYARGDIVYSGICCQLNKSVGLSAAKCWATRECRSVICQRSRNILMNQFPESKSIDRIDLLYGVFILTSKCNLRCKYCVQFIPNYENKKMVHIPLENVKKDIKNYLGFIDTVGTISAMGGETFLHPDLGEIAKEFCKYDNFGFISFPTNGLVQIKEKQLEGMHDKRVVIPFGYYLHVANERQKEIYQKNIDLVKKSGVAYIESSPLPAWLDSKRLTKFNNSTEYMTARKLLCPSPPRNLQVRDGKIYVCDRSVALHAMGIVDYPNDYFNLSDNCSIIEKRRKFIDFMNRDYYYTCAHCPFDMRDKVPVAEQGVIDVFAPYSTKYFNEITDRLRQFERRKKNLSVK